MLESQPRGVRLPQLLDQPGRDRQRHRRLRSHQAEEARLVEAQHLAVLVRANSRGPRLAGEQRDLADRIAASARGESNLAGDALGVHAKGPTADQVQSVARVALAAQHLDRRDHHRLEVRRELGQRDAVQSAEQLESTEQLGVLPAQGRGHRPQE